MRISHCDCRAVLIAVAIGANRRLHQLRGLLVKWRFFTNYSNRLAKGGRFAPSTHEVSRCRTDPARIKACIRSHVHGPSTWCPVCGALISRPFGQSFIAASAIHGGEAASASPENIITGISDFIGWMKSSGTFPLGHSAHAAM